MLFYFILLAFIVFIGNMYFSSTSLWLLTLFVGSFLIISIHNMRKNNSIIQVEEYKNKEHSHEEIEGKIDNLSKKVQKLLLEKEQGNLADQVELEKEQWDMGQEKFETMVKEAKEHITKIEEAINEEQKELDSARADST